jgi:hypothetical protein
LFTGLQRRCDGAYSRICVHRAPESDSIY